jgi:hypothetical protein
MYLSGVPFSDGCVFKLCPITLRTQPKEKTVLAGLPCSILTMYSVITLMTSHNTAKAKTVLAGLEPLPPAPPPPPPPPSCHQTKVVGCYNSSSANGGSTGMSPWLPNYQPQVHDRVTLEDCAGACDDVKMPLAGVDAGNHCWCGHSVTGVPAARERPQAECEVDRCHGNTSELCGGDLRMLVYNFACTPPALHHHP